MALLPNKQGTRLVIVFISSLHGSLLLCSGKNTRRQYVRRGWDTRLVNVWAVFCERHPHESVDIVALNHCSARRVHRLVIVTKKTYS